jgi:hypothetical protein
MNFDERVEVDFHEQDKASVFLETNSVDNDGFAELLLFCCL